MLEVFVRKVLWIKQWLKESRKNSKPDEIPHCILSHKDTQMVHAKVSLLLWPEIWSSHSDRAFLLQIEGKAQHATTKKKKKEKRETFSGVCLFEVNSFFSLTSSVLLASLYLHSDATLIREAHSWKSLWVLTLSFHMRLKCWRTFLSV